jgi:drug/metabolite transporter (DMT)-like permease
MVPFIAVCYVGDSFNKCDIISLVIAFIGILLILQPFSLTGSIMLNTDQLVKDIFGCVLALVSAIFGVFALIFLKLMLMGGVSHNVAPVWYSFGFAVGAPIILYFQEWEHVQDNSLGPRND